MANMTLAVPDELQQRMRRRTEIRWGDVARQAFERKLAELDILDRMLQGSKLTEKDAETIGHSIKKRMRERFA